MYFRLLFLLFLLPIFTIAQNIVSTDSIIVSNDTIIQLQEVSVSASEKSKVTGLLSGDLILHVEGIKSVPSLTGTVDVLKVLELTPSVRTSGDGSTNMYVRGGDAGQNLLLYNGVTCYTPGHVLGMFPLFNSDHLSSLTLSKSGADAAYGDFISSVIDVSSKREVPKAFSVKGNVGLLASQVTLDIPVGDKWGVYLSGRKTYLDLLLTPLLDATINNKADDDITDIKYDFWDTNLSIIGEISANHKIMIDGFISEDKLDLADEEILIDGALKWRNATASVKLQSNIGESLQLSQIVSFSQFRNTLDTKQEEMHVGLYSQVTDYGYKNQLDYFLFDVPFSSGLSYTFHEVEPHNLSLVNSGVVPNSVKEEKVYAHAISAFLSTTLRPYKKLSIKPGLRYNLFQSKQNISRETKAFHSVDLRLALQYQLRDNLFARMNYSYNHQYLNKLTPSSVGLPTDFWIAANSDISPQRGQEVSVGLYKALFDGGWEVSTDVYYRIMNNVTQFDYNFIENDNSSFVDKIHYGTGRAYGWEIMLKKNFEKLTGWLSYALAKTDRKIDEINNGNRFPARFDRRHDLSLNVNYKFSKKVDATFTYIYATGNTYTQPTSWYFINNLPVKEYTDYNNARMPNYNRADIGLNYWFTKDNGLNLSIYNMFVVENPIYVFMLVKENSDKNIAIEMKRKKLYTIIPSISWNFKF